MPTVDEITARLEEIAPLALAEEWDNVGLLLGDRGQVVDRLMTCLTLTSATVSEAIREHAKLVVVHHPLPFRPLSRVTTDTMTGRLIWDLIRAGISVYSAHTAFDSARDGINEQWAQALELQKIEPLAIAEANIGAGRCGQLPSTHTLAELAARVKSFLSLPGVRVVGSDTQPVRCVAIACGSGGSLLDAALVKGCDCFVTGETSFHTCLEAESRGMALVLCGHYASERFAMDQLAGTLVKAFPDVTTWASRTEQDPLRTI